MKVVSLGTNSKKSVSCEVEMTQSTFSGTVETQHTLETTHPINCSWKPQIFQGASNQHSTGEEWWWDFGCQDGLLGSKD